MISKAELHLRARPLGEHRSIGVVEVEYAGPRLAPHQEVSFEMAGRDIRAYVTGIRARPDRLPHVYVDEVRADAALEAEARCLGSQAAPVSHSGPGWRDPARAVGCREA